MVSPQQDESIYSVPLIQYAPDSASGSQLANASFQEPSTYGSLEYPNYAHDWTMRGPGIYGGIPAANQLPRKSEFPEIEARFYRTNQFDVNRQLPSTDGRTTLPTDVQAFFSSGPDPFPHLAMPLPRMTRMSTDGSSSFDSNRPLVSSSSAVTTGPPYPSENPSWLPHTWDTFDSNPLAASYPGTTTGSHFTRAVPSTFVSPISNIFPEHSASQPLTGAWHPASSIEAGLDVPLEYPYPNQWPVASTASAGALLHEQQNKPLPQNSQGPHSQSQWGGDSNLSAPFIRMETLFDLSAEAPTIATTNPFRRPVDRSETLATNQSANIVQGIELQWPRPVEGETIVRVRREKLITLSFDMQDLLGGSVTYDGLKIPSTRSVQNHQDEGGKKLLHLHILVLGATSKTPYNTVCDGCKNRTGRHDPPLLDFHARSNILVPDSRDNVVSVQFKLSCYSKHRYPNDSEYSLVVILNDDTTPNTPLIRYELPYSFGIVAKSPPRTRNWTENNAVASHPPRTEILRRIYLLHPVHRQILYSVLEWEFYQLYDDSKHGKSLIKRDFNGAKDLLSRVAPISRIPVEVQRELLLWSIQSASHSPMHLMQVCRSWYIVITGISRLWSSLELGTWTAVEQVASKLERAREWPLDVKIDTMVGIERVDASRPRYQALSAAIQTMARWKALKIVTFTTNDNEDDSHDEANLISLISQPLSNLESFTMLDPCHRSPFAHKILSTISTTNKERLKVLQIPCPTVILKLAGHGDGSIFHNLTILKVQMKSTLPDVGIIQFDLLPHMKCVEVLELASMSFPNYPLSTTLPLAQTLLQLSLKATSIQWLFGRTLSKLQSCTIISPLRIGPAGYTETHLPSCSELWYDGHPYDPLRHFALPKITTLRLRNNEWSQKRADQQPDWMRAELIEGQLRGITVLSIDLICFSENQLKLLAPLSCLREFTLRTITPSGLSCRLLSKFCAKPLTNSGGVHWSTGLREKGEWQVLLWPLLKTLRLEFRRWVRSTERENIVPLLAAIAWTRMRLDDPLQHFEILVEEKMKDGIPLELVRESLSPLQAFSLNNWEGNYQHPEEALEAVITSVMFKITEIRSMGTLRILLLPPCRSLLHKLRSLKLHYSAGSRDPVNILPHLENLEVLDMHSVHIPDYSLDTDLKLVRTLKRLSLRHISIQWMMGRHFKRLEECSIWNPFPVSFTDASAIKMPVCTRMLFGDRSLERLGLFDLPSLAKLALANPWFPDLPSLASRWVKGVESTSETVKVISLQLEVSICNSDFINVLRLQPRLEELMLRVWEHDGLFAVLSAFITDSNVPEFEGSCIGDDTGNGATVITTEAILPLCPQLQVLNLKLENVNYEERRTILLPFCKMILGSRRSRGRPLRSFKVSWQFDEREEELVP